MSVGAPQKEVIPADRGPHPLPWPYSHGIKVGNTLYVAGQVALDEELRLVGPGDAQAQARQTWTNIQTRDRHDHRRAPAEVEVGVERL